MVRRQPLTRTLLFFSLAGRREHHIHAQAPQLVEARRGVALPLSAPPWNPTKKPAPEVVAAYDAPFPDDSYKAGARIFPSLVPSMPDDPASADNAAAWEVFARWEKPWLCTFSDSDPVTKGGDGIFLRTVPGTQGQPHVTIQGGGHFLQEDKGPEVAAALAAFVGASGRH